MGSPRALEAWATVRLESMGVDGVFAPYVIGMLGDPDAATGDSDDEVMFSVHQVLMGWLSPEDEDIAMEFVEDLLKFHRNPALLPVDKPVGGGGDTLGFSDGTVDAELKASAPLFVPHYEESLSGPLSSGASTDGVGEYDHADESDAPVVDVMQDEETFFWSVAFDLVGHLQLKFPEVDPTRMCDLLKVVELDVDTAHAVLKATLEKETTGITQVCRHYLAGDCRRADCMFVHDTHTVTCRFWLRGMCMQSDNCVFAHEFAEFYALDHAASRRRECDSEDEGDDGLVLNFDAEEMFPSLGAAASSSSGKKSSSSSPSPSTTSSSSSGGAGSSWGSHKADPVGSLSLNFARAVSVQPSHDESGSGRYGYHSPAPPPRRAPAPTRRPLYHKTAETVSGSRWLTTGSAVTAQYRQLREEAYELACARNKCFMQATRAYQSGNRSLARSLSAQGHEYNVRMKRCHYNAALQIFESRNPKSQIYHDRVMDLHGLHVAEAVEFLSAMLATLADDGIESIHIVTGSGHHSKGSTGNARLLPAVERFLATEGYQFSPVADRRGYVGMLMVDLRW